METTHHERLELGNLHPDLIHSIFSLIPLVSLSRSKSVSKSWYNYITTLRHSTPLPTTTGLVVFLKHLKLDPNLHETTFLRVQDPTHFQEPIFIASFTLKFPWLIDTCNGFLLYSIKNVENGCWEYSVYSPANNQCVSLPPSGCDVERSVKESLAFDGVCENGFRVVCYFWNEVDVDQETMNCRIFDSRVWKWREIRARVEKASLLRDDGFFRGDCFGPSVFRRRNLYWLWSLCMLVYEDDGECFELIKLPNYKYSTRPTSPCMSRLLWVSEDLVHYGEGTEEFNIYTYVDDQDDTGYKSRWRYRWRIVIGRLGSPGGIRFRVLPCAFNEDLQVLYFQGKGTIFGYSLETQRLEEVYHCGEPGEDFFRCIVYPFRFNSANFESR